MELDNEFSDDELDLFGDDGEYDNELDQIANDVANEPDYDSGQIHDHIAIKDTPIKDITEEFDNDEPNADEFDNTDGGDIDIRTQLIFDVLKAKGIEDIEKIKFEGEDGQIEEVSFYDLSYEEQSEILKSSDQDIDFGLNDDEVNTINLLRNNGIQLSDLIEYYKQEAVQEYVSSLEEDVFEVDNFSNDELYALDLKAKYADLTNDEIVDIVEHEKQNETLYNRKVEILRKSYKEAEEHNRTEAQESTKRQEAEKIIKLENDLNSVAGTIEDIGGLDLDVSDKDETLKMILEKDLNGKSDLDKYLEDPKNLFKMAWLAKYGDDAFDVLHNYYRGEIDKVRKSSYDKAKKEAAEKAKKNTNKTTSGLVVKNPRKDDTVNQRARYHFSDGDITQDDLFK